ncbi:MAG TPA: aldo/keto reductase [Beijerinckiaceae bacterium]|jgi:aryl-alcohol dehydrogenase-like predicted oxidoreductase
MTQTATAKRPIGRSGLTTFPIGLGCMSLSSVYGPVTDEQATAVVRAALDAGVTMFDTADMYGGGHNETLLGRALAGRRDGVIVATKFGNLGGKDGKFADGRPEYVIASCEASLKRLGMDVIDLYYQHRVDPDVPIEDTVGAMARLVEQGKVRALGLSEAHPETIRRAHAVYPISAVQSEYSLLYRNEAEETRAVTRDLGVSFVAYSPLGRGLLTAQAENLRALAKTDARNRHPRFAAENLDVNMALADRLRAIADGKGCTIGQLALAWLLAQGEDVIAIPGTTRERNLLENVAAAKVALTADEIAEIDRLIPKGSARGLRYPEAQLPSVHI